MPLSCTMWQSSGFLTGAFGYIGFSLGLCEMSTSIAGRREYRLCFGSQLTGHCLISRELFIRGASDMDNPLSDPDPNPKLEDIARDEFLIFM